MGTEAVTDTGPVLHLDEIGARKALEPWSLSTSNLVAEELATFSIKHTILVISAPVKATEFLAKKHDIAPADASVLALALAKQAYVFTDDLDVRQAAKAEGLEPHGTIGIIVAAYARNVLSQEEAARALWDLDENSTLFLTKKLIEDAVAAVKHHSFKTKSSSDKR